MLVDRRTDGGGWQLRRWAGSARARHRRREANGNYKTTCVRSNARGLMSQYLCDYGG